MPRNRQPPHASAVRSRPPHTPGEKLRQGAIAGLKKGWRSFLWMAKILVPVSLLVVLLKWTGWLHQADFLLDPVMRLLNLPSEAAFPILSAIFINIYATIAVLTVVPFSVGQMTLIAIFSLIAHNLITEAIIQHNSGMNGLKVTIIRLLVAVAAVLLVSPFIGETSQSISVITEVAQQQPFLPTVIAWAQDTGWMLLRILGIIMAIMVALECLSALGWDGYLFRFFRPFMKVLGLSDRTVMLWVTAVVFGLMYGSAVILERSKRDGLTKSELERLHISIGVNHSMVEDPALYLALGLNWLWLVVPKLLLAMAAVHLYRAYEWLRGRRRQGTV